MLGHLFLVPLTFVVVFINAEQQQKNNDHDVASLVAEMKTKLDTLGVKVESQAVRIDKLENELTKANEKIDQLLMESNDDDHVNSKSSPAQIIKPQSLQTQYRSCHEFYSATLRNYKEIGFEGVPIKSGMFYIDLDGQGVGEPPIYVYCNMTDGTTSIGHDITDEVVTVDKCPTAGCFSREITYDASPTKLESLVRMSDRCTQQIKIDCFSVPLEYNGVQYAWWVDRRGSPRYFWSGNQSNAMAVDRRSNHTCQCGIDYDENKQSSSSCVDLNHKCQCDSLAPVALSDDGLISDKDLLPVTRLHFGRTAIPRTLIKFTLGRLNCKGPNSLSSGDGLISSNDELPTNCDQLRSLGHRLAGFYSVKDGDQIKTVFCRAASLSYGNTPVPAAALQSQRPNIATDGKPSVTGPMPTDCDGAKALGWTHSGFYTVKGSTAQLKTVYCDFTKIAGATGYETPIGYNDIKTASGVYFFVYRNQTLLSSDDGTVIPYQVSLLNIGDAMNLATGVFTVSVNGRYYFSVSALSWNVETGNRIFIRLNGDAIGTSWATGQDIPMTLSATLNLNKGDTVDTYLDAGSLYEGPHYHYTLFTGHLLEQDLVL